MNENLWYVFVVEGNEWAAIAGPFANASDCSDACDAEVEALGDDADCYHVDGATLAILRKIAPDASIDLSAVVAA